MKAVLIANPEDGSIKTTHSPNTENYLASRCQQVAMLPVWLEQVID